MKDDRNRVPWAPTNAMPPKGGGGRHRAVRSFSGGLLLAFALSAAPAGAAEAPGSAAGTDEILDALEAIETRLIRLEEGQARLEAGQTALEARQAVLAGKTDTLEWLVTMGLGFITLLFSVILAYSFYQFHVLRQEMNRGMDQLGQRIDRLVDKMDGVQQMLMQYLMTQQTAAQQTAAQQAGHRYGTKPEAESLDYSGVAEPRGQGKGEGKKARGAK